MQSPPRREWLLASSKAFKTVSYLELKLTPTILWTLWTILAAVAYSEAVFGSSQAVLWMQLNFSSAPEAYRIKHIPPLRSDLETIEVSFVDLAEKTEPTLNIPMPKTMAFRRIRMIKLVKLSVRTSEVEDARAKSSDVNSINGAAIFVEIGLNLFKLVQTCLSGSRLV